MMHSALVGLYRASGESLRLVSGGELDLGLHELNRPPDVLRASSASVEVPAISPSRLLTSAGLPLGKRRFLLFTSGFINAPGSNAHRRGVQCSGCRPLVVRTVMVHWRPGLQSLPSAIGGGLPTPPQRADRRLGLQRPSRLPRSFVNASARHKR